MVVESPWVTGIFFVSPKKAPGMGWDSEVKRRCVSTLAVPLAE